MHRLTADTECGGDGLPTPPLLTGVSDVDGLQPFLQSLQCLHRAQADGRVCAAHAFGKRIEVGHNFKLMTTRHGVNQH
jgi:hypothetical protein